jgi:SecD/SecF fusion protein
MLKRNLWKLILSAVILVWALSELVPVTDTPFATYVRGHATVQTAEFGKLLDEAVALTAAKKSPNDYASLKAIAAERKIDLSKFFPDIRLETSLRNIEKRNAVVLSELSRMSRAKLQRGLDLQGGVSVTLEVDDSKAGPDLNEATRTEKLAKAVEILSDRVNKSGVVEPIIRPVGTNRIEIQLPGDPKQTPDIIEDVKRPAKLDFRIVHPTFRPTGAANEEIPPGYEIMGLDFEDANGGLGSEELFIKRIPEMGGEMIANSGVYRDQYGKAEVQMQFTSEGRKKFAEVTAAIAEGGARAGTTGRLAIVLDGKLYSAPTVKQEIDSPSAVITGNFTDREAFNLANVLNNPLDLPLRVQDQYEVGPSLAKDAIDSGITSAVIGTAAVAAFMILFYTTGGLVAIVTLAINIAIILGVMASFNATMTLPGLAGIVLTIGMAVDANILIFERMREELAAGKNLATSNQSGFLKALTTILDAHIVQLIICAIMIKFGTGPIKGFGVTLAIGVVSTLISVLITAHMLMEFIIEGGWIKAMKMRHLLKHINVDFIKYGKPAFIGSWIVVLIGVGVVLYKGSAIYGIDFAGGDEVTLSFKQRLETGQIRAVAQEAKTGEIVTTYASAMGGGNEILRIETATGKSAALVSALQAKFPQAELKVDGTKAIGASVGAEIKQNALLAVGLSMAAILIYIAFRFEFGFGVGAMFSTLHDILMTIGIFVIFGHQFSAPMVAAILCIAGYSINETVVVFDRIREELKLNPTGSLRDVVNLAINKVFARTIMTASTTFLAALALFLFGGGILRDISFTFIVGIITSTFSAIFIAAQVFYWWHKGDRKHVEAHADVAPRYEWQGASKASE